MCYHYYVLIALIAEHPITKTHLDANASIVHNKSFERGVIRLQKGVPEASLTADEKRSLLGFLKDDVTTDNNNNEEASVTPDDEDEEMGFADVIIESEREAKKARLECQSKYIGFDWIPPTSNVVERLFSRAKIIMTERRQRMTPRHLELLLFLRLNKWAWNVYTIDDIISKDMNSINSK